MVYGQDPESYLGLIRQPAKTAFQTGQVAAIILADGLVVQLPSVQPNSATQVIELSGIPYMDCLESQLLCNCDTLFNLHRNLQ